jgi:tRNA(Ile)-lysidine synthase
LATADLAEILARLPRPGTGGCYRVAYSGGLDSTVLLHLLAHADLSAPLQAVHVHHGLQPAADGWVTHCERICRQLKTPFLALQVKPERGPGLSLEAEARKTRYDALRASMQAGDVLLTAHHLDDQGETLLLQLLRGAGPRGLAAMPAVSEFAPGWHARPLLGYTRVQLEAYARQYALEWIEDPSNTDTAHARNFLRGEVMPKLRQRWPELAGMLGRSTNLCAESASLLDALAEEDLEWCAGEESGSLLIPALRKLEPARRRNLLRAWIGWLGLPLPEFQHLQRVDAELLDAAVDATPVLAWPGVELRRYRECIFALRPLSEPDDQWRAMWQPGARLQLPEDCGWIDAESTTAAALRLPQPDEHVSLRLAQEGEWVQLPGHEHRHALKNLCQQAGIPPWLRRRLPIVMYGEQPAAIADRWVCEGFASTAGQAGWRLRWHDTPPGYPRV